MFDLFAPETDCKQPRPYQMEAIQGIRQSMARGNKRVALQLPTGSGKTMVASLIVDMARDKGKRVVFTVPALSLIDQTVEAFEAEGIRDVGVIQSAHPRTNPNCPVQIASVQTLARRDEIPADLVIVDEAHIGSKVIRDWMKREPRLPFVGLSATPWRKGMAEEYSALVVGQTMGGLISDGYLSPFRVYAPAHPDLTGVKTQAGDFHTGQLSDAMQRGSLVADVVRTWLECGEGRPTLCFGVDCAHAQHMQRQFQAAGVACGYIDAHTDMIERDVIRDQFHAGKLQVVCNVGTLTTGVDWDVRCIILARPTKSEMLYCQIIGRGLRIADGKEDCLILDHSDTTLNLGFVTDIHHGELFSGKVREAAKREVSEPLPKACVKCAYIKPPKTHICPKCGFAAEKQSAVEVEEGRLVQVKGGKKTFTAAEKQDWYSMLVTVQRERKRSIGWLAHAYRDKFGVWPRGMSDTPKQPSEEVRRFVKAKDIRFAKSRGVKNAA